MRRISIVIISQIVLFGCAGTAKKEVKTYAAGEKAPVGKLLYSVIDSQIATKLGDDPINPRTPQNRFVMIQVAVFNSGSQDEPIPAMSLVDDSGTAYNELADGTGVPKWMGVVRRVSGNQTEQGIVLFDAPAKHYRLRLTEEPDDDIGIDVPLDFAHEQTGLPTQLQDSAPVIVIPKK
jgi:hypothetical protein